MDDDDLGRLLWFGLAGVVAVSLAGWLFSHVSHLGPVDHIEDLVSTGGAEGVLRVLIVVGLAVLAGVIGLRLLRWRMRRRSRHRAERAPSGPD